MLRSSLLSHHAFPHYLPWYQGAAPAFLPGLGPPVPSSRKVVRAAVLVSFQISKETFSTFNHCAVSRRHLSVGGELGGGRDGSRAAENLVKGLGDLRGRGCGLLHEEGALLNPAQKIPYRHVAG